jgi:hypothetical protein
MCAVGDAHPSLNNLIDAAWVGTARAVRRAEPSKLRSLFILLIRILCDGFRFVSYSPFPIICITAFCCKTVCISFDWCWHFTIYISVDIFPMISQHCFCMHDGKANLSTTVEQVVLLEFDGTIL